MIHDPLVEWTSGSARASRSTLEPTNEMVRFHIISIKIVKKSPRVRESFHTLSRKLTSTILFRKPNLIAYTWLLLHRIVRMSGFLLDIFWLSDHPVCVNDWQHNNYKYTRIPFKYIPREDFQICFLFHLLTFFLEYNIFHAVLRSFLTILLLYVHFHLDWFRCSAVCNFWQW